MSSHKTSFWFTSRGLAALGLIAAASYFLLIEHREHVWQFLPYLILLACPFMHLFMHGGHGGHGGHGEHTDHSSHNKEEAGSVDEAYQRGLEDGRRQSHDHRHHVTDESGEK